MKMHYIFLVILQTAASSILFAQDHETQLNDLSMDVPVYSLIAESQEYEDLNLKPHIHTRTAAFQYTREYPNLHSFVKSTIKFPEEGRLTGRYGKVKVQFDILPNGDVGEIRFLESPHPVYEKEVTRILQSMPAWTPAYIDKVPVTSQYHLTLNFSLQ